MAWKNWRNEVPKVAVHMSCFDLKRRSGKQKHVLYRLIDPMTVENKTSGETLSVPAGTLSDGSSVPGALWAALDADPGDLLLPGFAHDYAYREGAKLQKPGGGSRVINRYEADLLHIAICRILRVKKADQAKIFYALRVGGSFAFRNKPASWDGQS